MHPLVADVAVAGVPEPVPVVAEAQFVKGAQRGGPEEHVPVNAGRRRRVRLVADGGAALVTKSLGLVHLADQPTLQGGNGAHLKGIAAVLRANLHHALGVARRLQQLLAFVDAISGGLFAIDILAGFERPDGRECVPVVGRSNGDGVHAGVGEHRSHILKLFGLLARVFQEGGLRALARGLVHVAQGHHFGFGQTRVDVEVIGAPATEPHDGDIETLVGAVDAQGGCGGGRAHKKSPGGGRRRFVAHRGEDIRKRRDAILGRSASA